MLWYITNSPPLNQLDNLDGLNKEPYITVNKSSQNKIRASAIRLDPRLEITHFPDVAQELGINGLGEEVLIKGL